MARQRRDNSGRASRSPAAANDHAVYLPDAHPPKKRPILLAFAASALALWLAFLTWLVATS